MTPDQLQLARRRLWLGIANVGFWVLAAGAGLCWLVIDPARAVGLPAFLGICAGAVALQAVFDFIGGLTLMPGVRQSLVTFLCHWSRGVLTHTLVLAAVGIASVLSLRWTGGFGAGLVLATLALALGRRLLLRAMGTVAFTEQMPDGETILTAAVKDPAFTGGIVGFGRRAKSLLPANWMDAVPGTEIAAESCRRRWQIANALSVRALTLILSWNLLGTFIGTQVFQLAARPPAAALLGHACWMTIWTFASLLVLPSLSRGAIFAADCAAGIPNTTLPHGSRASRIWSARTAVPTPPCRPFFTQSHRRASVCASLRIRRAVSSLAILPVTIFSTRGAPSPCSAALFTATWDGPCYGSFHHPHEA